MPNRTLILMRHAKQSGLADRDHDRPLTDEGRGDAHNVGERLGREAFLPSYVLSSTALRCQQTWQAVDAALASGVAPDFEPDLYNASSKDLLDAIAGVPNEFESLLVLAHNPGISVLAHHLAGENQQDADTLQVGFRPATTARFEVEEDWAKLSPRTAQLRQFDHA